MVTREQVEPGVRIVENDPEEPNDNPYKGTVTGIEESGEGIFLVAIDLDQEFMEKEHYQTMCPEGKMLCFPWAIDVLTDE